MSVPRHTITYFTQAYIVFNYSGNILVHLQDGQRFPHDLMVYDYESCHPYFCDRGTLCDIRFYQRILIILAKY